MSLLIQLDLVSEDPDRFYSAQVPDAQHLGYATLTEMRAVATTPTVGQPIAVEGETWVIANVVSYEDQFYLVTGTQDGRYPAYRLGWHHDEAMFLGIYTDLDLQPTHAEGYEACFSARSEHLSLNSNSDGDFESHALQILRLTGEGVPWGYERVHLDRCTEKAAIAVQG